MCTSVTATTFTFSFFFRLGFPLINSSYTLLKANRILCDKKDRYTQTNIICYYTSTYTNRLNTFFNSFSHYSEKLVRHESMTEKMELNDLWYRWGRGGWQSLSNLHVCAPNSRYPTVDFAVIPYRGCWSPPRSLELHCPRRRWERSKTEEDWTSSTPFLLQCVLRAHNLKIELWKTEPLKHAESWLQVLCFLSV